MAAPRHANPRPQRQIERELAHRKLKLAGYFLIVWDLVHFCREQNILVQGRGSAANSAVCYSLGITAVDPSAWSFSSNVFYPKSAASGPTSISTCPAATSAKKLSNMSTSVMARAARL
jgi:error-prone DNA polymerase